ncbi:MAG TPA: 2-amino-4-oxopentanoate thiolase subunit OrtA [Candidatus Deferrimicrobium sp.]|nr:2-amino-4-oxopentanoate thiolase subunit OrtA [Candidatus Deferrimicrobium sp.]
MQSAKRGDWVQVHNILLEAGKRAPQVPEDTQQVPLEMWVKGFLLDHSTEIGQEAQINTVTGRIVTGKLVEIMPTYPHNFGEPQPELLTLGIELRRLLKGESR